MRTARTCGHGGSSAAARSSPSATTERPAPPSVVCVLTFLEVRDAVWKRSSSVEDVTPSACAVSSARFTWPAISRSPTTIESRPDATANRCSATSVPARVRNDASASATSTPDASATMRATCSVACCTPVPSRGASTSRYSSNRLHVARTTAPVITSHAATAEPPIEWAPVESRSRASRSSSWWLAVRERRATVPPI
ncbi:Uncharacterised protein [Mycobacteroides abscessus]|nr:Uncharacterised protein [Mycobacteroides abscessus]